MEGGGLGGARELRERGEKSEGGVKGLGERRENEQVRSVRLRELGKGSTK